MQFQNANANEETRPADTEQCSHAHTMVTEAQGEVVCCTCGFVLERVMSDVEWRNGVDDNRVRCDMSQTGTGAPASKILGNTSLAKYQRGMSTTSTDRLLYETQERVESICHCLLLSDGLCQEASAILRQLSECLSAWRGSRRTGLILSCVSIACERNSVGITDYEIVSCPAASQPLKVLNKQKKVVLQELHNRNVTIDACSQPSEYAIRFCQKLGFDFKMTMWISHAAAQLQRRSYMESKPCAMIVACATLRVLYKNDLSASIQRICKTCSVTMPTLTKWLSECSRVSSKKAKLMITAIDNGSPD